MSRPILLALVAAILALVAFYATTGARTSGDDGGAPAPAERAPAKPDPAPAKSADARGSTAAPAPGRRSSADRRPAGRSAARRAGPGGAGPGVPADVARALDRGRTVVLFFFQRGAADDDATARAVAAVRRRGGASVFSAPISRLADYRAVIAGAGVSQAPAVLILRGRSGTGSRSGGASGPAVRARLVEGFVDPETLIQQVADAR